MSSIPTYGHEYAALYAALTEAGILVDGQVAGGDADAADVFEAVKAAGFHLITEPMIARRLVDHAIKHARKAGYEEALLAFQGYVDDRQELSEADQALIEDYAAYLRWRNEGGAR